MEAPFASVLPSQAWRKGGGTPGQNEETQARHASLPIQTEAGAVAGGCRWCFVLLAACGTNEVGSPNQRKARLASL